MTTGQRLADARARRDRAFALYREIRKETERQRQVACDAYNIIYNECLALAAQKAAENS